MVEYIVRDSDGERETFAGGAVRDTQEDKTQYSLIPPPAMKRLADLYTKGAQKYAAHNYLKGMPTARIMDSLMRHVELYRAGDREEDHLAAVAWNAFAIMMFEYTKWDNIMDWREVWTEAVDED